MTSAGHDPASVGLARFLLARVDEEELALRSLVRRTRRAGSHDRDQSFAHLRVDLLAKRQVLGHVQHLLVLRDLPREKAVRDLAVQMLQSMAEPYSDHLQYRAIWHRTDIDAPGSPGQRSQSATVRR